jgi:glycerol uptake facilitator-like aquaporin
MRPKLIAEGLGTGLLVCAVVGSGIMAQRLFPESVGLALLANTFATVGALMALILALGPVSGAHFNPVVSLDAARRGELAPRLSLAYAMVQIGGAILGALLANAMFQRPVPEFSAHLRSGAPLWLGEGVATFALLLVIRGCTQAKSPFTPFAVAGVIAGAYWFTSSTSFANPAVTLGRMFSDSFAGIAPRSAPAFLLAQLLGGAAASFVADLLAVG